MDREATHLGRALGLGLGYFAAPLVQVIDGAFGHVNTRPVRLGAHDGSDLSRALSASTAQAGAADVRARGKGTVE